MSEKLIVKKTIDLPEFIINEYFTYMHHRINYALKFLQKNDKFDYVFIKNVNFHENLSNQDNFEWVKVHHIHYGLSHLGKEKHLKWHMRDPYWISPFTFLQEEYLERFGVVLVDESDSVKSHKPYMRIYRNKMAYNKVEHHELWHHLSMINFTFSTDVPIQKDNISAFRKFLNVGKLPTIYEEDEN